MQARPAPLARCARGCAPPRAAPFAATCAPTSPRCALAELVPNHLLGDEHGHMLAAVVDRDRVPDHLWEDGGRTRPGPDHPLLVLLVHRLDAAHQPLLDERPLLAAATHLALLLTSSAGADDQLVRFLVLAAGGAF